MRLTTIKLRRLERGFLQVELAQRANIARCRLSELENGHIEPRLDEIERIARALDVPAEALAREPVFVENAPRGTHTSNQRVWTTARV
jgi:transcriptional regulator with XRE-family HTH domain